MTPSAASVNDPLERFVLAQADSFDQALRELNQGKKRTHWIWFILPQLRDLGRSSTARRYGITGLREAQMYLEHPVLGPRLLQCVSAMLGHTDLTAVEILGEVDALKFRSCLTLFSVAAPDQESFRQALQAFYQGSPDSETLRLLSGNQGEA